MKLRTGGEPLGVWPLNCKEPAYLLYFASHRAAAVMKRNQDNELFPPHWGQHVRLAWQPNEEVDERINYRKRRERKRQAMAAAALFPNQLNSNHGIQNTPGEHSVSYAEYQPTGSTSMDPDNVEVRLLPIFDCQLPENVPRIQPFVPIRTTTTETAVTGTFGIVHKVLKQAGLDNDWPSVADKENKDSLFPGASGSTENRAQSLVVAVDRAQALSGQEDNAQAWGGPANNAQAWGGSANIAQAWGRPANNAQAWGDPARNSQSGGACSGNTSLLGFSYTGGSFSSNNNLPGATYQGLEDHTPLYMRQPWHNNQILMNLEESSNTLIDLYNTFVDPHGPPLFEKKKPQGTSPIVDGSRPILGRGGKDKSSNEASMDLDDSGPSTRPNPTLGKSIRF